jgi:hypothetical protein
MHEKISSPLSTNWPLDSRSYESESGEEEAKENGHNINFMIFNVLRAEWSGLHS